MEQRRPKTFDRIVGQARAKKLLEQGCRRALDWNRPLRHVLLSGPPGLGKTTLAGAVAETLGTKCVSVLGPAVDKAIDLLRTVMRVEHHGILFIDEVHGLSPKAQECLYTLLEDFSIPVEVEGTDAMFEVAPFTMIGATTHPGLLRAPFRDRFSLQIALEPYSVEEIASILAPHPALDEETSLAIASRARGVPRLGLQLANIVVDHCHAHRCPTTVDIVETILDGYGVRADGLTDEDIRYLRRLKGKGMGLSNLIQVMNLPSSTITTVIEPHLMRQGLVEIYPAGRRLTPKGRALLKELDHAGIHT